MDDKRAIPGSKAEGLTLARIGEGLAVVAAGAGAVYAVGVVILAVQLWITYRFDFATTWYAASLVSTRVVLGQGIRVWWSNPISLVFLVVLLYWTVRPPRRVALAAEEGAPSTVTPRAYYRRFGPLYILWPMTKGMKIAVAVIVVLIGVTLVEFGISAIQAQWRAAFLNLARSLAAWGITGAVAFVGGGILVASSHRGTPLLPRLLGACALAFVLTVSLAVVRAELHQPPLPMVELSTSPTTTVRGRLLSHEGSYWHIIVEPGGTLLSVPDGTASTVGLPRIPGTPGTPGTPQRVP